MPVRFDGSGDGVRFSTSSPPAMTGVTVIWWRRVVTKNDNTSRTELFLERTGDFVAARHTVSGTNVNQWQAPGGSAGGFSPAAPKDDGTWVMFAHVCNGTGANGSQLYSWDLGAADSAFNLAQSQHVGAAAINQWGLGNYGGEYRDAEYCFVKIWNVALSLAELQAERVQGAAVRTANLSAQLRLPNISDLTDSSGNGRNGTAQGTLANTATGEPVPWQAISVTDFDGDEIIRADQLNCVITGSGFGATQGAGSVTLIQGGVSIPQSIDSWSNTSIQVDTVFERVGTDLKHGAATLRVTANDASFSNLAITIVPPTGQLFVDLTSVYTTAGQRLASAAELVIGDQIHARGVGGGAAPAGLVLNADGTYYWTAGSTPVDFEYRVWDAADQTWGAYAIAAVVDTVPDSFTFPSLVDQELATVVQSAIVTLAGVNVPVQVAVSQGEMRIAGGPWISGQSAISSGQTLQLRHLSATTELTSVTTTATIGNVVGSFTSTTKDVPDPQAEVITPVPPSESPRPRTIEEAFVIDFGGNDRELTIRIRRRD